MSLSPNHWGIIRWLNAKEVRELDLSCIYVVVQSQCFFFRLNTRSFTSPTYQSEFKVTGVPLSDFSSILKSSIFILKIKGYQKNNSIATILKLDIMTFPLSKTVMSTFEEISMIRFEDIEKPMGSEITETVGRTKIIRTRLSFG